MKRISPLSLTLLLFLLAGACKTPSALQGDINSGADRAAYTRLAKTLGLELSGKEDLRLLEEIAAWIGTPYRYGGAERSGTDCSGFTMAVIKKVYGISLYRSSADQIKNTSPVKPDELRCGDLLFFKIKGDKISHVGMYIASGRFVHASVQRGVVVNALSEDYYKKYFSSAGRIEGIK